MTFGEELESLRLTFGSREVVSVRATLYLNGDHMTKIIDSYESRVTTALALGDKLSPLEQLGVWVLREAGSLP